MHSDNIFIKLLRILLFPVSLLYGGIVWMRNFLYDKGILHSVTFDLPVICIGNLSVGGTGKSPMTELLVSFLKERYLIGIVSRGYGRLTKGFVLATADATAKEIGDEPLQFKLRFPGTVVAVGERRMEAIPQLLYNHPEVEVILLDDAFQHRQVKAGYNILLTEYDHLYTRDQLLPTGNLRDVKSSARRADVVVVTKCPANLTAQDKALLQKSLHLKPHQQLFLAAFDYGIPYHLFTQQSSAIPGAASLLMVTAIANPQKMSTHLAQAGQVVETMRYKDHHHYTAQDIDFIKQRFNDITSANKMIITTSKDAVKLRQFDTFKELPVYVLPVRHTILLGEEAHFKNLVLHAVARLQPARSAV